MATNTPRKARVAAASSAAAAVANTVIDSVIASGAAQLHLSDEVLEKLRVGWRDLYNELSGFTEEEIAREGAGRKRTLSSSDENGVRDGASDVDQRDEAAAAPTAAAAAAGSDSEDNSSTGASDSAAASNGAAGGGGGSATAVSAPAPYVVGTPAPFMPAPPQVVDDSERRRQNHLEATKRRRVQAAGKAQREARKASLAAAAEAPPVPVTAPFVADGILMGTFSRRIRGNKEDNTLTVYVENALLRGKSRDLVFGSVKCSLRLEQLRDMRLDSEEDIAFFARAPAEEAVAEQEREEKLRHETGELDFTDVDEMFGDVPAAAVSAAAEVDDAGYGAVKRARGRPRKQKTQQQQNQQQQQQKQKQKPQQKQQQKSSTAANNSGSSSSSSSSISSNMTAEQLAPYTMFGAEFMKAIGISTDKLKGDLVDPMAEALAASAKLMAADSNHTASSTTSTTTITAAAAAAVDDPFGAVLAAAATMPDVNMDVEPEATATTDACSSDEDDPYETALASVADVHRPAVRAAKTPDAVVNAMSRAGVYNQYNSDDD
jgi:hypothetical protein